MNAQQLGSKVHGGWAHSSGEGSSVQYVSRHRRVYAQNSLHPRATIIFRIFASICHEVLLFLSLHAVHSFIPHTHTLKWPVYLISATLCKTGKKNRFAWQTSREICGFANKWQTHSPCSQRSAAVTEQALPHFNFWWKKIWCFGGKHSNGYVGYA